MSTSKVSPVLYEFTLPISNDENANLEKEYTESLKLCSIVKVELREEEEEVEDLCSNYKTLQQQLNCMHIFLHARNNELETEKSLLKLIRRQKEKTQVEVVKEGKNNGRLEELNDNAQKLVERQEDELKCREEGMGQMREKMVEWMDELEGTQEIEGVFRKYHALDKAKIKEFLLGISSLSELLYNKKISFDKQQAEGNALKYSLNKTLDELKRCHFDRKELIKRLMDLVHIIVRKDQDISMLKKMTRNLENEMSGRVAFKKEKDVMLERQLATNNKLEKKVTNLTNLKERQRNILIELEEKMLVLTHKYRSLRIQLDRTSLDLELMRSSVNKHKLDATEQIERLRQTAREICRLVGEERQTDLKNKSRQEKLELMQDNIRQNEVLKNKVHLELSELTKRHYLKNLETKEEMEKKRMFLTQITLIRTTFVKMQDETEKLERTKLQKMKFLFIKELNMQMMTRKLHMLEGHLVLQEQTVMISQVREKALILEECNKSLLFWTTQSRNVKGTRHRKEYECDKMMTLKKDVSHSLQEAQLQIRFSSQVWEALHEEKKELMLNGSMLRMVVEKLLMLRDRGLDEKVGSEDTKEVLMGQMAEKKMEIQANKGRLKAQMQLTKVKKRDLSLEIADKECKAVQLSKKYEVLVTFMKSSSSEPEHSSPVHFIMRSIVEKEEFKTKGNILNSEVTKLEQELRGLKNTVLLVKCSNDKRVFNISNTEKEVLEKGRLEGVLKKVMSDISLRRKQTKDTNGAIMKEKESVEAIIQTHQRQLASYRIVEDQWHHSRVRLDKQEGKYARALNNLQRNLSVSKDSNIKHEIILSGVERFCEVAVMWLKDVCVKDKKFMQFLQKKFEEMNFKFFMRFLKKLEVADGGGRRTIHLSLSSSTNSRSSCSSAADETPCFQSVPHMIQKVIDKNKSILELDATAIYLNATNQSLTEG